MKRIADGLLGQPVEHLLDALLEVAAVAGAGHQRAQIQRIHRGALQRLGHVALMDAQRQALGQRGLPDAGLADQQRVVLAPPAQHLDDALELGGPPNQRIDAALGGLGVQVGRVGLQRIGGRRRRSPAGVSAGTGCAAPPCEITRSSVSRSTPLDRRK